MYLPTFQKLTHELYLRRLLRVAPYGLPAALWVSVLFYNQIYNVIFTQFIPPRSGVQRRVVEE